jgi:hypothetical protein
MLDHGYSIERPGRELGIAPHRVRYPLQLMALDPSLQDMLQGQNSAPVAHEIGRLLNPPEQRRVASLVIQGSVSNDKLSIGAEL